MYARRPGAADGDDVLNLGEAQPETASAPDEGEQAEHCLGINTIPGRCTTRGGQDAPSFVDQERLPAESGLGRDLADPQSLCHAPSLRPAPGGRVKRKCSIASWPSTKCSGTERPKESGAISGQDDRAGLRSSRADSSTPPLEGSQGAPSRDGLYHAISAVSIAFRRRRELHAADEEQDHAKHRNREEPEQRRDGIGTPETLSKGADLLAAIRRPAAALNSGLNTRV